MSLRVVHGSYVAGLATLLLTGCFGTAASVDLAAGPDSATADAPGALPDALAPADSPAHDALADASSPIDATVDAPPGDAGAVDAAVSAVLTTPVDPFPDASAPGLYCCPGCPQVDVSGLDDAGYVVVAPVSTPTNVFSGAVTGADGDGVYYVVGASGDVNRELIPTDTAGGTYSVNGLLFCGSQTVKETWSNAQGSCTLIERITRTADDGGPCDNPDMQVSLAWDALGIDWELHLIRQGGTINDMNGNDCTWTTCISSHPDWGVIGDPTDDPSKDVDNTGPYGPENIFLNRPEAITYTVMVEHWGSGQPGASGTVTINLKGQAPVVIAKNGLAPQHVWKAATIAYDPDGGTPVVTPYADDIDCTASWSGGCTLPIP